MFFHKTLDEQSNKFYLRSRLELIAYHLNIRYMPFTPSQDE